MAVKHNGKLLLVKNIDVQSPSARGAATLYKMRFTDIATGQKVEDRFKGDDSLEMVDLTRAPATFSYIDGDDYMAAKDKAIKKAMGKDVEEAAIPEKNITLADALERYSFGELLDTAEEFY